jgi:hypothetical protein
MKRARLASLPAGPKQEQADLTDRLLEREAGTQPDRPKVAAEAAKSAKPKRRRKTAGTAGQGEANAAAEVAQPKREHELPAIVLAELEKPQRETPAARRGVSTSVEEALRQAEAAAQALRQAARSTPARFEVAQGYRLDALAHHIRQVAEFISGLPKE